MKSFFVWYDGSSAHWSPTCRARGAGVKTKRRAVRTIGTQVLLNTGISKTLVPICTSCWDPK